jgi:SDR family mycofactocin-dependent oxidoreductase
MGRVSGKVAFVTGAARGQGRAHALRLAEEGADIIAVDLCGPVPDLQYPPATPDDLAETVKQIEALDRRIVAHQADVRDMGALTAAVNDGVAKLGGLDIVVGNAGICIIADAESTTPEIWKNTIDTNLTGVWHTVQAAIPHLKARGGGSIILTSSAAGLVALPFLTAYIAAKHGVTGLGKAYALELGRFNIRVNTLHPGGVDTAMGGMGAAFPEFIEKNPGIVMGGYGVLPETTTQPVDQANAVLWLASDEAKFVTGTQISVDSGMVVC